ncbi:DUF689-domain-containing protein [Durotheca rogersii]|uniref:DUF689-domain-containing protein n=1 Tax=Durotheca rogersii TaxID=419775 RepID=UPI0022205FDE|nr:DUF689-domain-containing protein [Durotheca rogersii]KAI5855055.1 DUF689-domain-containing protein [Durotheca rogersii]
MSPSLVILDNTPDLDFYASNSSRNGPSAPRTLLLAPPSIAGHEENLRHVSVAYDRSATDLQMLDRLALGLVNLPHATYDLILVLTDADGTRSESTLLLDRHVFAKIVPTLKAGGKIRAQDGSLVQSSNTPDAREALLAGLIPRVDGFEKVDNWTTAAVPLKLGTGNNKKRCTVGSTIKNVTFHPDKGNNTNLNLRPVATKAPSLSLIKSAGLLGVVRDDDELIDEDALLTEEDVNVPLVIPAGCIPKVGKRRRACKDCTCGLAERLAAEDASKRDEADIRLEALKLGAGDLNEVDFTVKGRIGSCGNCSLGDAFRCDGCPYIGLPAFKPGEEVRLLNNVVQL